MRLKNDDDDDDGLQTWEMESVCRVQISVEFRCVRFRPNTFGEQVRI